MSGESPSPKASNAFARLGEFKPKGPAETAAISEATPEIRKDIDQVAAENGFHSREAVRPEPKRRRFGAAEPKKQLNIKTPVPLHERYYRMAEERGHSDLYLLLEQALDALEEKEQRDKDIQ